MKDMEAHLWKLAHECAPILNVETDVFEAFKKGELGKLDHNTKVINS